MATIRNSLTDNSAKDTTGDAINGSEVDLNPQTIADILDGTTATDLGQVGTVDVRNLVGKVVDNAAASVKTALVVEWDPADDLNMTDNSSGIGIDFKLPDDADTQTVFASLDVMCRDDAAASEDGEFSFRVMVAATDTEVATLNSGLTTTGTVLTLMTGETTVVDGDILGKIEFQAPSEASGTDAILVGAAIWAEADDTFAADNNDTDLVFAIAESEAAAERMRLAWDGTTTQLYFAQVCNIESSADITLTPVGDVNLPANIGLTFGNDGEKIEGDGTDLTIAGNNINLTAVADVVVPANVGITFGSGEKIEGDNTDLTVTSGGAINLTATTDVVIPANVGVTFGTGEKIEGDNTDLTITSGGILNLALTGVLAIAAPDATLYDDNNNADTSLSIGTSATERLKVEVLNGAANKSAESVNITSVTAAAGANAGQITIGVDEATILTIDDSGINAVLGATTPAAASATTITGSGVLSVDDTTDTTSATTGSIHTDGGVGIAKALWVGTTSRLVGAVTADAVVSVDDTTDSTSTTTGSVHTDGGVGIAKDLILSDTSTMFFGIAANSFMTSGITVDQTTNDDQAFALMSTGDVAHDMTGEVTASTYFSISKIQTTSGGARIRAFKDADGVAGSCVYIEGDLGEAADTTKSTAAQAVIHLEAMITNGAGGLTDVGANGNLVVIGNNNTQRFIFDAEGSGHADVEFTTYDEHDDLMALDQLEVLAANTKPRLTPDRYGGNALLYGKEWFEENGIVGKDSWHCENGKLRSMINFTKLAMLHHGAILQLADRHLGSESRLDKLERENKKLQRLLEARN